MIARGTLHAFGLLAACAASGCTSLATQIAEPRSERLIDEATQLQFEDQVGITTAQMRTPEGLKIAYRKVPVAERGMQYDFTRKPGGGVSFATHFAPSDSARPLPARGTIIYLHGWSLDSRSMELWALALSEQGYRGIAMDLRNHGESGRAPAGYGMREAGDIVALLDVLESQGEFQPPVFLFGVSYGATTALLAEPALRGRIVGIVALEPYANAADGIHALISGALSMPANGSGEWLARTYARHRYDDATIDREIVEAGQRLQLDLATVDAGKVLARSTTCTLLLHGTRDGLIPVATARGLAQASPRVRYRELPDEGHMSLPARIDWLTLPISDWLQSTSIGNNCVDLALPPDPAPAISEDQR